MLRVIIASFILIISSPCFGQEKLQPEDLQRIIGDWEGSLTYLDYQTGNPFTMRANLVGKAGKNEYSIVLNNIFPDEPRANSSEKIKLSKDGLILNGGIVTSAKNLEDGSIEVQTESNGKDDNRKALIRYTYLIGDDRFTMRKDVRFDDSNRWIKRNEFAYKRKK